MVAIKSVAYTRHVFGNVRHFFWWLGVSTHSCRADVCIPNMLFTENLHLTSFRFLI
jgi:hypothetical protein